MAAFGIKAVKEEGVDGRGSKKGWVDEANEVAGFEARPKVERVKQ